MNQLQAFYKVLKKYKLLYPFKQSLKQCIYSYMNNCNNKAIPSTWSTLIGKAIVENKEHLIDEVMELLKLHNIIYDQHRAISDILRHPLPISYEHIVYLRDEIYKEVNANG